MLSTNDYKYYQPQRYTDDGTNIEWGDMPYELHSFDAFQSIADCRYWLQKNGYEPDDFAIVEYMNDDIEDVRLLDENGNVIMPIEEVPVDGIINMLGDEVIRNAGSIENLRRLKQDNETEDEYKDRIYGDALDLVNDAVCTIEEANNYNFAGYWASPDIDWFDEARDDAVKDVMRWMMGEYGN